MNPLKKAIPYIAAISGIGVVTLVFFSFHPQIADFAPVALSLVLVVLFVATYGGTYPAMVAAMLGTLAFDFFFLPPLYTLNTFAPRNWIVIGGGVISALTGRTIFAISAFLFDFFGIPLLFSQPLIESQDRIVLIVFIITAITGGNLSIRVRRRAEEAEIGRREIERLYADLQQENKARKLAEEEVRKRRGELQRLSAQLVNAQEAERRKISQELHDEMGQALTAIHINLAAIEKALLPTLAPAIAERFTETRLVAVHALEQIRELALSLRPAMLDDLGLVPTLHWYITSYAKRLNIDVQFEAAHFERRLNPELETTFYRIIQEALTNVAKHAQATRVLIRLACREAIVTAHIEDNGRGFESQHRMDYDNPTQGVGLLGIQERVSLLGGTFQIQSQRGQGTKITLELPRRDAR